MLLSTCVHLIFAGHSWYVSGCAYHWCGITSRTLDRCRQRRSTAPINAVHHPVADRLVGRPKSPQPIASPSRRRLFRDAHLVSASRTSCCASVVVVHDDDFARARPTTTFTAATRGKRTTTNSNKATAAAAQQRSTGRHAGFGIDRARAGLLVLAPGSNFSVRCGLPATALGGCVAVYQYDCWW